MVAGLAMAAPDIEGWIATSGASHLEAEDDDVDAGRTVVSLERAREDWSAFIQYTQNRLLSSKTKSRTSFLKEQILPMTRSHGEIRPRRGCSRVC